MVPQNAAPIAGRVQGLFRPIGAGGALLGTAIDRCVSYPGDNKRGRPTITT
jgi:hypothetical protein